MIYSLKHNSTDLSSGQDSVYKSFYLLSGKTCFQEKYLVGCILSSCFFTANLIPQFQISFLITVKGVCA